MPRGHAPAQAHETAITNLSKKIFLAQPFNQEADATFSLVQAAVSRAVPDALLYRSSDLSGTTVIEGIYNALETADLIICDTSDRNPNVLYELGYAHGVRKPVILISKRPEHTPFDIRTVRIIFYELSVSSNANFFGQLANLIQEAIANPAAFSTRPSAEPSINSVFVSYSHRDSEFLDRLMIHLRPLGTAGLIDLWVDTRIRAGDKWQSKIEEALKQARVAILLVTADFLASKFIVENKLPPILSQAESKGTRIIPIVLKPCRFTRDRNLSIFQAINDPKKPLAMLSDSEKEEIYDSVSELIEGFMAR